MYVLLIIFTAFVFLAGMVFNKLSVIETQQVDQNREARQDMAMEQHNEAIEMQPTPQLSESSLVQEQEKTIINLKSEINRLQTQLAESDKSRRGCLYYLNFMHTKMHVAISLLELQKVLQGQYHTPTVAIVLGSSKKDWYSFEDYKISIHDMRNGRENRFPSDASETDDASGIEKDSATVLHTTVCNVN